MESGTDLKHLVLFNKGQPTSNLTYTLFNQDGNIVETDSVSTNLGQMSYLIEIAGSSNTLSKPLYEQMKLQWSYTTADSAIVDSFKYLLHTPILFAVSKDSVRSLLGVNEDELTDQEIDLFAGYLAFLDKLPTGADLSAYENAGTFNSYRISGAIEASTALSIFPTMQIRLPKRYGSGTSEYERWTSIDWEALGAELSSKLMTGLNVIDPDLQLFELTDIFGLSTAPVDVITAT